MADNKTFLCQICNKSKKTDEIISAQSVPEPIVRIIKKENFAWSPDGFICRDDLDHFRARYIEVMLEEERNDLASLEESVIETMKDHEHPAKNTNIVFERQLTFGERLSDRMADFAGSWTFVIIFSGIMTLWIIANTFIIITRPFDPYPYILLNLCLSTVAALQAPIIIMSQNRHEIRDRLNAEQDYQVNQHAETEIHQLHKKIDHLIFKQGQKLFEIQNIQLELMQDLIRKPYDGPIISEIV